MILREDPEILKRCDDDGLMGSALNSQVTFGKGFPFAVQVKRAVEPGETSWSVGPSVIDTGSVEDRPEEHHEVWLHTSNTLCFLVFNLPRTITVYFALTTGPSSVSAAQV